MPLPYSGFLLVVAMATIAARILSQVEWWQRKEYRWDRVRSQLFSNEIATLISPLLVLASGATLLAWAAFFSASRTQAQLFGIAGLVLIAAYDGWRILRRGVSRPVPTAKGILLTASVAGVMAAVALNFIGRTGVLSLELATLALGVALVVPVCVWLVSIPVELRKKDIIARAKKVRQSSAAVALGITGSFGKTSTKFFLQQLLKDEPGVIATAEHRNSALAVAQDLLQQLGRDTRTYIVEMAAYREGEIRDICEIVQPRFGLITAIGNQHVALFGSIAAVARAKWELIEALPIGGVAILNADNKTIIERSKEVRQRIIWFSCEGAKPPVGQVDVSVSDVTIKPHQIMAVLRVGTAQHQVILPLVSRAMLGSAVAAAAGAHALGVSPTTIFRNIQRLVPYPRTMAYQRNTRGTAVIDDSYSGNEAGVLAAIEHLEQFANMRKIVVFTPLIELGRSGPAVHQKIGAALAKSGATVYATNALYQEDLLKGGRRVAPDFLVTVQSNPANLLAALTPAMTGNTVVLLEGRLAELVRLGVIN